jgi:indolepyruvate ferredoxin oxidoreductase beta subunit
MMERWLSAVAAAIKCDVALGREVAELGRLIKGYSDTHRRAQRNFNRLMDTVVAPALAASNVTADYYVNVAAALATARKAALADPEGEALDTTLAKLNYPAAVNG